MLSVVIPAYKEPYLQQTINSLLANAKGEIEVIAVLDGYWPTPQLDADPRVHIVHLGERRGLRAAINAGVAIAKGEYIMKADAHCDFAPDFDSVLLSRIEDDWVVVPRMYRLDVETWERTEEMPIDINKLIILEDPRKLQGQEWRSRTRKLAHEDISETMSFQGSCWLMSRKHWDAVVGPLQEEGYGPFTMEPIEIGMKTFAAGGKVMVNKATWYAHKHRRFNRTHNVTREEADAGNSFALEHWAQEYEKLKARFGI